LACRDVVADDSSRYSLTTDDADHAHELNDSRKNRESFKEYLNTSSPRKRGSNISLFLDRLDFRFLRNHTQARSPDTFDSDVTVSSPYDTPQRYADAFHVTGRMARFSVNARSFTIMLPSSFLRAICTV
jgi:hypothetical protein